MQAAVASLFAGIVTLEGQVCAQKRAHCSLLVCLAAPFLQVKICKYGNNNRNKQRECLLLPGGLLKSMKSVSLNILIFSSCCVTNGDLKGCLSLTFFSASKNVSLVMARVGKNTESSQEFSVTEEKVTDCVFFCLPPACINNNEHNNTSTPSLLPNLTFTLTLFHSPCFKILAAS